MLPPEIGPGSPECARNCKLRVSASFSTGALESSGGGGDRTPNHPVSSRMLYPIELHPHWEGILGIRPRNALNSSFSERDVVVGNLGALRMLVRFPAKKHVVTLFLSFDLVRVVHKAAEHLVDGSHWGCVFGKVKSILIKQSANVLSGQSFLGFLQYHSNGVRNAHSNNAHPESNPSQWGEVIEHSLKMLNLGSYLAKLGFQSRALTFQAILLQEVLVPLPIKI